MELSREKKGTHCGSGPKEALSELTRRYPNAGNDRLLILSTLYRTKEVKMLKRTVHLLLVASLITKSLTAADNPFVGKWKLNGSKSRLPDEMKVKKVGANKYAFAFEGG